MVGNIVVSDHARRQMRKRLGSGCNQHAVAQRAWSIGNKPPVEWEVPIVPGCWYVRYGDHVFIYARRRREPITLKTVVGPLGNGKKWQGKYPKKLF